MSDDEEEGRLRIDEGDSDTEEIKPQPRAPPLLPEVVVSKPPLDFPSSSNASESKDEDVSGKEDGELDEDDDEEEEQQEEEEEEEEREEDDEEMDTDDTEPKLTIVEDPDELMEVSKTPEPPKVQKKEEVPVKIEEEKEDIVMSEPSSPASSKQSDEPEIKKEEPLDEQDLKIETDTDRATTPDKAPQLSPAPSSKNENGLMKPPQSTEKAPRKRKESADNFSNDKRNIPSSSDTPRSKRSSSQYAKLAISACLADEDIVSLPMMPIQTPPQTKRAKRDVSTSVITTRSTDIDGLINDESILSTPPGTPLLLEITVMYRTRSSLAFRIKGCEMIGFIGDGLSPIISAVAANTASTSGNNNNKKKANNSSNNEEGKDGRSSSASSNGRSARGGSVLKDGKADKQKGKKKKEEPSNEDIDEESQSVDNSGYDKCELKEVDVTQYHDCHYDGCEKRFQQSQELDYHISKYHKKRVMIYESICTQTDISSISTQDVGTETDDLSAMPVLKKEVPIKQPTYEDLSDDDMDSKPAELAALKVPSTSSAAAALMGIAQQTASATPVVQRSTPSTPISAKIGINPQMIALAEKSKQQQQQQQKMVASSPRPNQHPVSAIPSTSAQPPVLIQTHPMGGHQFIAPGFHPGLIHHPNHMAALAAAMDPRMVAISQQQQQQQMARTPSRQSGQDSHKIHELAKTKENENRQRQQSATPKTPAGSGPAQGAVTPQRPFIPPQMMQAPPGTPQSVQQQQAAQQQAVQQQNLAAQQQLLQMQLRGMVPQMPNQQEQLLMMMMGLGGMPIPGAVPGAPGFPQQQQPPK